MCKRPWELWVKIELLAWQRGRQAVIFHQAASRGAGQSRRRAGVIRPAHQKDNSSGCVLPGRRGGKTHTSVGIFTVEIEIKVRPKPDI